MRVHKCYLLAFIYSIRLNGWLPFSEVGGRGELGPLFFQEGGALGFFLLFVCNYLFFSDCLQSASGWIFFFFKFVT